MSGRRELAQAIAEREVKALTLDLARAILDFLEPPTVRSLSDLRAIRDNLDELETMLAYQLRQDGVTWEEMAHTLQVTRQSINRRLSRKIDGFITSVYSKLTHHESGRAVVLKFNSNVDAIRTIASDLRYLDTTPR